jgi:isopropanol dehydrogenase (NADP+)
MKAFVMKAIGQVGFMEKPIPHAGPDDAIVKTTRALICTSDSHTVGGAIGPRENLTLGHEAVGIVYEVGSNVKLFKPGDRVLVGAITPDWGDPASQAGHSSQSGAPLGGWKFSNSKDGVFAEYFHVNEADANMAFIPASVPDEVAVYCADMLSTGFMGAEYGDIPVGGTVAVFAQGGNLTLWLKSCGSYDRKSTESSNLSFLPPSHSALYQLYFHGNSVNSPSHWGCMCPSHEHMGCTL